MQTIQTDVLVIGAGPAGTVAAAIIKKAGYQVEMVEKLKFPRFVIGESLLPRCMEALEEAGFLDAIKAKGFQEKYGAKFVKDGQICDFRFEDQYTNGYNWTWQVPRADFDHTLATCCEDMGIPLHYETEVTAIRFNEDGSSVTTVKDIDGNERQIEARFVVDGSGYGRVIPSLFGLDKPSGQKGRKTLFAHIVDTKRDMVHEPNRITVYIHKEQTWIWVIPFSNGNTSVGFVSDPSFFEDYTGTPEEMYRAMLSNEPELAERFEGAELVFEPRTLQSWSSTADKFFGNGYVLTGNVTEFLDPIFSSGVTLATVSAQTAAHLVIRHLQGEQIDWEKEYMEPTMQGVNTFRTYVNSWYDGSLFKIFFAKEPNMHMKNQICSVLAGYVWDTNNPFVKNSEKSVKTLLNFIVEMEKTEM
jgi:flavin-dependent dehydrogenase